MAGVAAILVIGGLGAFAVLAVNGPPPARPEATRPPDKSPEQKLDEWMQRRRENAERAARSNAGEAARWRDRGGERHDFERRRARVNEVPERERTAEMRREEAAALRSLARLDRDDGRLEASIGAFQSMLELFRRMRDPDSRKAAVQTTLEMADALDARGREREAREAYRRAIDAQRELAEQAEPERRSGVAGALLRYARFEAGRRRDDTARTALDEAGGHYEALRAQRGQLEVMQARAELAIMGGRGDEARRLIVAMRTLAEQAGLAGHDAEIDALAGRLELSEGRAEAGLALFQRAAAALRRAGESPELRRREARAVLGAAEAAFDLNRIALGREFVAAALALYRTAGERALAVEALARLALWEAAAGETAAAERALADALALQRGSGEPRAAAEPERIFDLLCAGVLAQGEACRTRPARSGD